MVRIAKSSLVSKILLVLISTLGTILVIEVTFRWIGYDFGQQQSAFAALPIYYRQPVVPVGDVFFRRPGPAFWHGNVLATGLKSVGDLENAYTDEPAVTITYDNDGFRNPEPFTNWDLVVVGDSFVELGHLPYEELFTTHLGRLLGQNVKNLGVSYVGPLTYSFYLRRYGPAPDAKQALMVFFEGNDLSDLLREEQDLQTFKATGNRPYRDITRQTSFLKACRQLVRRLLGKKEIVNAYFVHPHTGEEVAVTVAATPPEGFWLPPDQRALLERALSEWAVTAQSLGMTPWLVYMPSKRRVLAGHLRFVEDAPEDVVGWRPTDLPGFVRELSERKGIGFIDVTPALVSETEQGTLTYNTVWDTHLNRHGSAVVARVIADALGGARAE